jgi:hypothetical protein
MTVFKNDYSLPGSQFYLCVDAGMIYLVVVELYIDMIPIFILLLKLLLFLLKLMNQKVQREVAK